MHKLKENIDKELNAIEEKGLTSNNIDNVYKLVIMKEKMLKTDMLENEMDHSQARDGYSRNNSMDYDAMNSYRRGRNERTGEYMHRPDYSRLAGDETDMEKYRKMKREYSQAGDNGSKNKMLDALDDFMAGIAGMLRQILRDADMREEREIVQKYCKQITDM